MATLFIALVFALIIALFALQNTAMVTVRFLSWEHEASVVLVVIGAACFGGIGICRFTRPPLSADEGNAPPR